tara:strand:- start:31962 stop:32216 length:255 start_codon:yes stop_codon:yes gene_type:complete
MNLEEKINSIMERNSRVESDKAWETSKTRRLLLAAATYILILYFLILIDAPNPYLNALIPAAAYLIQQYSVPFIKNLWIKNIKK